MRRDHNQVKMPVARITEDNLRRITSFEIRNHHAATEILGDKFVHLLAGSCNQTLISTVCRGDLDHVKRGDFRPELHCHRADRMSNSYATLGEVYWE